MKNNEFSQAELVSVGIDTSDYFIAYSNWIGPYNFESAEREDYRIKNDSYDSPMAENKFIRFGSDGTLEFYSISRNELLRGESLNQQRTMVGVYDIHKNLIHTKRYLGIGHGPKLIRGKIRIEGDTLHFIEKMNIGVNSPHRQYIKTDLDNWE